MFLSGFHADDLDQVGGIGKICRMTVTYQTGSVTCRLTKRTVKDVFLSKTLIPHVQRMKKTNKPMFFAHFVCKNLVHRVLHSMLQI